ncbi:MAG: M1 family metallopeptidase [Bryobacterales bacterium]|nr:M1 family metallopeptidase [Bryobacterales bacterium]
MSIDRHSYSNPGQVRVKHLDLDLTVHFDRRILDGTATLTLVRKEDGVPLVLDTRDLKIDKVETAGKSDGPYEPAGFTLGARDPILGSPLTIQADDGANFVRIHYATSPEATALQWLTPEQTAGKRRPYLYTQSQAIHARSWIPLQDSPGVRMTYRARIRTPKDLIALMSARADFRLADPKQAATGDYTFRMPQAIPSYLIALAVGDVEFRYLSSRSGVWAEPPVVDKAAAEFVDTERMIQAAEKLYGPYEWLRYDILVLPPSFPFGGMENPLLTFATPTVIAGDKSLVNLVAHELAHSWSGNLVTNETWSDFWLNEGFTTYVERRILEVVYGEARARMEAVLGRQELEREMARLPERDQILHIDLTGRDPDDGATLVPYEKGALFLTALEQAFGRERVDAWLLAYFRNVRFESITTAVFQAFLRDNLLRKDSAAAAKVPVEEWLTKPGIPAGAPRITSDAFVPVDEVAAIWVARNAPETKARTREWCTQQWQHFLRAFPNTVGPAKMAQLDRVFGFSKSGNSEILFEWLMMTVRNGYTPAYPELERFLMTVGRRKFIKPLYEELAKTPEGKARAEAIYGKARPGYHPIAVATIDGILRNGAAQ